MEQEGARTPVTMERVRVEMCSPLPEPVKVMLSRLAPSKTARVETFTSEATDDATAIMRKRFTLEDTASLTIRSSSGSPQDEYLVAYQKHHRRGIHVWEVRCSAHHNHTIQGLVRVAVVREQTPGAVHMSGLTFAINIRRNSMPDPAQLVQTAMHGSHYLVILDTLNDEPTIGWARDNRVIARERYHGDELSFYLFLLEIEPVGDYEVMTQYLGVCYEPLSLERLCRLAVRQHLQSLNQLDNIQQLPLPGLLRDFIEQADKVSDET